MYLHVQRNLEVSQVVDPSSVHQAQLHCPADGALKFDCLKGRALILLHLPEVARNRSNRPRQASRGSPSPSSSSPETNSEKFTGSIELFTP